MTASELDAHVHALLVPGFVGHDVPDWLRRRLDAGLGAVAIFARNVVGTEQLRLLTADLHRRRPGLLVALDEEGGDVTRLGAVDGSRHPGARALGTIDDVALTRRVASSIGADLDAAGIDWDWAPVADVNSNPDNPVIGVRSFGADAALVARHAAAAVTGLQDDAGILACAKHFPGHGDTAVDSHHDLPMVSASLEELREVALLPFRSCVAAGVRSVMTGHLRMLALDPQEPATLSRAVVTGLLRGELGFDGAVVSDALEMAGVAQHCGIEEGAVRALLAGVDSLCLGGHLAADDVVDRVHRAVVAAVRSGRLGEDRVLEASGRVAALATWRAQRAGRGCAPMTDAAALAAAARALRVDGDVRLGAGAPVVITCDPEPLVASGPGPWGIDATLRRAVPGVSSVRFTDQDAAGRIGAVLSPDGPPLVLVVRDADRSPWQQHLVGEVLLRRPDVVVVEMGVPSRCTEQATRRITTSGTSRGAVLAVVAALTGSAPRGTAPTEQAPIDPAPADPAPADPAPAPSQTRETP